MNQNQIGRTVFDIDEETNAFYLQKAIEYHEWLLQQEAQPRLTRTPIFRDRKDAERRLQADYFDDHAGANNDINVLDNSPLFDDLLDELAHVVSYVVEILKMRKVEEGGVMMDGTCQHSTTKVDADDVTCDEVT
nr:hypothetical protein [Tanacetum cinerariifolium]